MICVSVASCGWLTKVPKDDSNIVYGTQMFTSYTMNATNWQVDSICKADDLPNIDTWILNGFKDYETGENIVKRMYIKQTGKNEIIYIVTGTNEPYIVTRRITK